MRLKKVEAAPIRLKSHGSGLSYTCAVIRISDSDGRIGWGETECPAPEAVCALVAQLLRYGLEERELEPDAAAVSSIWYESAEELRRMGHAGGLMYDALAAIDLALWDLASQAAGVSVARLLSGKARESLRALWCGPEDGVSLVQAMDRGVRHWKLRHTASEHDLLVHLDELRLRHGRGVEIAVDGRWRLDYSTGPRLGVQLDRLGVLWLECPMAADNPSWHGLLASKIHTPIALGQVYRSLSELNPFFETGAMRVVQPEVGRMGLSEAMRVCRVASSYCMTVSPRAGWSAGPKLAAAVQLAAAAPECEVLMYRPEAVELASARLSRAPVVVDGCYRVDDSPGLGVRC